MTASIVPGGADGSREAAAPSGATTEGLHWRAMAIAFLSVSLVVAIAGLVVYQAARESVTHAVTQNLQAIATLKATHLDHWLDEKRYDVHSLMNAEFATAGFAGAVRTWLAGGMRDDGLRAGLRDKLRRISATHRCLEISLRSGQDGRLLLSSDEEPDSARTRGLALASVRSGKTVIEDFHIEDTGGVPKMHVGFLNPLPIGGADVVVEVTLDAGEILYPTIEQWPGWNISAATRLLRRDSNTVVALNSLQRVSDNVLSLGFSTPAQADSIHADAIQVGTGALRGNGLRKQPVFAYALPVPHSPWTLVAEVGEQDAYAKLNMMAAMTAAIVVLLMLSGGWWLVQQSRITIARVRHDAERKLLTTRIDFLAKYANDCIVLCDASGRITEVNDRCISAYGYAQDELLRMNLDDLHAADDRSAVPQLLRQIPEATGLIHESAHQRKDGSAFDVEMSCSLINVNGRPCYQAIIRDISERKKQQLERERHTQLLSRLTCRLVHVQEEERRHLSGELHDQVGANLATMNLNLRSIGKMLPAPDPQRLQSVLAETRELLAETISGIRDYCADLRPAILDYSGLVPALEELLQRFGRHSDIATHFRQDNMHERLSPQTESMLFRIAQEALTNCAKHSNATAVVVALRRQGRKVVLTVSDDGDGFDPRLLGTRQVGMGLLTMSERAAMSGGTLSIVSAPGKGTQVRVGVKVAAEAAGDTATAAAGKAAGQVAAPSGTA
jgi:PAS domain S-box-containing protein